MQVWPSRFLPSQSSKESITPSPQNANLQLVRQASGLVSELAEPLSHSSPTSSTPLPQTDAATHPLLSKRQSAPQASVPLWNPSVEHVKPPRSAPSQASPVSRWPLPHTAEAGAKRVSARPQRLAP